MSIFKAYDIRGVYSKNTDENSINEDIIYKIGRAYVLKFKPKKVTVGMDGRTSSPSLFKAIVKGITDEGCDCVDIGLVTTPMMYFSTWNYPEFDGGLMVSASHNPPKFNGVKMVGKGGIPIGGETGIYEIGKMIENLPDELPEKKGRVESLNIFNPYAIHSLNYFPTNLKRFKIVIDTANGVGGPIATEIFNKINCEFIHLFKEVDGNFPNHEANPMKEENILDLRKSIIENNADLGVGFDGDADRCAFLDEKGHMIQSDMIIALVAKSILKKTPNKKIFADVRCSKSIIQTIKDNNGIAGRCKVGHSLIKEQMRKEDVYFAGELSSHFYLKAEHYAEAPFFIISTILEEMTKQDMPISEIIKPFMKYYQSGEINSVVEDKDAKMNEIKDKFSDAKINWLEGITVEYDTWWFNVRKSNTESLLRLNLEADTKELMEEKRDLVLSIIKNQ